MSNLDTDTSIQPVLWVNPAVVLNFTIAANIQEQTHAQTLRRGRTMVLALGAVKKLLLLLRERGE
jgi:hypothetical protein